MPRPPSPALKRPNRKSKSKQSPSSSEAGAPATSVSGSGPAGNKYCATCGRIITPTRKHHNFAERKYCSKACSAPRIRPGLLDRDIERTFVRMAIALGEADRRRGVECGVVQGMFERTMSGGGETGTVECGSADREQETETTEKRRRFVPLEAQSALADEEDTPSTPNHDSEESEPEKPSLTQEGGMAKAAFRERVRRAGRRVVAFGAPPPERAVEGELIGGGVRVADVPGKEERELEGWTFECVQKGKVVESSFAKGEWGVRVVERG